MNGSGLELTCVGCGFNASFSVGADFVVDLVNQSCVTGPNTECFTLTRAEVNFTVLSLENSVNLEVFLEHQFPVHLKWP